MLSPGLYHIHEVLHMATLDVNGGGAGGGQLS